MVLTLELPIRPRVVAALAAAGSDPLQAYETRFGAAPAWFDEISPSRCRALASRALRQGVPVAAADYLS